MLPKKPWIPLKTRAFGVCLLLMWIGRVSVEIGTKYVQVQTLDIPTDGLIVYLKQVGWVKVFRTVFKNEFRYYVVFVSNSEKLPSITRTEFQKIHDQHWGIEQYHRALKPLCNIEGFQVRESQAIRTHIFCAIRGFIQLEFLRFKAQIVNWYSWQRELFTEVIRSFIVNNLASNFLDLNNLEAIVWSSKAYYGNSVNA